MMADHDEKPPIVLVIDDDPSIRRALDNLLRSTGLDVKTYPSTEAFEQDTRPDAPACLVLDVKMPGMSGLEFQKKLFESEHQLPIVFITGHGDIPMTVEAMRAGAIEFLTKPFRDKDLLDAIEKGLERNRARRRDLAMLSELRQRFAALSVREREVMSHVVTGRLNKQIAADLGVSEITVKVCRGQVMRKMKAASLAELVRLADRLRSTGPHNQTAATDHT